MQVEFTHAAGAPHVPFEAHVSSPLPEHCVAPGVHEPAHAPATHAEFEHATAVPHWPVAGSQVSTPLPLHCVWPGAHEPVQFPPRHVWLEHATGALHPPALLHVWTPLPEHCFVPGVHATHALFRQAGVELEHDRVAPGELLLEIDPTDYELTVRQAEKALSVELARLGLEEPPGPKADVSQIPSVVQAQVRMEKARGTLERMQAARSGVSTEDLAEKKADVRVTQAEHDNQVLLAKTALATIRLKQEALAIARQQLRDTEVRVPIPGPDTPTCADGVKYAITQRAVAIGTSVKSGGEVFKLAIVHTLKLRAPVPERYGAEVRTGQKALVSTASHAEPFEGIVSRINPAVDPLTRTFEVEILISNPKDELKPGGFAKTAILTRLDTDATTVPLESPVTFAGITKVFLVEDGRAREVQVTLGVQQTGWVEVRKPALPRGALVVTSGQSAIADQTPVTVRDTDKSSSSGSPALTLRALKTEH